MKPQIRLVEFANWSFGFLSCFFWVGGGGGDDDDSAMHTSRAISSEEPFHSVF